jgi:hypothetical protein
MLLWCEIYFESKKVFITSSQVVVLVISFLSSALSDTEPWYSIHGTWARENQNHSQYYGSGSASN